MTDRTVGAALSDLAAEVLAAAQASDAPEADRAAAQLSAEIERTAGAATTTVVVVGEKKRGKSSLINALLGRKDLLPVELDVATSVHIAVRHAPDQMARIYLHDEPDGVEIPLDAVAEYASVDGNRDPDHPERLLHEGVQAVELGIDHPLLADGMTLVDTPGVGGLEAGHTEITLATLSMADALLFVVDASTPFTAPETRFLERATERVATVVFALTKIDKFPGWRTILADNRELIARHAPRLADAPWLPVSSVLKTDADEATAAGRPDRAAERLGESGFLELEEVLRTAVVGRAETLRAANGAQAALTALDLLAEAEHTRIRSANGDPDLQRALDERQVQLKDFLSQSARWRRDVSAAFERVDRHLGREFGRRLNTVRRRIESDIADGSPEVLEQLPADLDTALRGVWMDLNQHLQRETAGILVGVERRFAIEGVGVDLLEIPYPEQLEELPPLVRAGEAGEGGLGEMLDKAMSIGGPALLLKAAIGSIGMSAAAGGAASGAAVGGGALAAGATSPVWLPAAGVAAGVFLGLRLFKHRRQRQQLLSTQRDGSKYLNQVLSQYATLEMPAELRDQLKVLSNQMVASVEARLIERKQELETTIAEHSRRTRSAQADRDRVRADAESALESIAAWRKRAEALRPGVTPAATAL